MNHCVPGCQQAAARVGHPSMATATRSNGSARIGRSRPLRTPWNSSCGRIALISIEQRTEFAGEADPHDDSLLRALLLRAATLRKAAENREEAQRVWAQIVEHEQYTIEQKVKLAGIRTHGRATVDEQDQGEVTVNVMRRVIRMMESFEGRAVGQLRKAINQAVDWEVATYGKKQAQRRERELPVDPQVWDPGSLDPEERPGFDLTAVITAGGVGDRIEMIERLKELDLLSEREVSVVVLRGGGHSSKEVADELGLTPANVDQIYRRSLLRLHAAHEEASRGG